MKRRAARSVPGVVPAIVDESALRLCTHAGSTGGAGADERRHTWECFNAYEWELGFSVLAPSRRATVKILVCGGRHYSDEEKVRVRWLGSSPTTTSASSSITVVHRADSPAASLG